MSDQMIYAQGPEQAKILLVGEAWGETEERLQQPFQGQAGRVLDGILEEVGIPRASCRITNVVHARPANNNFGVYYEDGKPSAYLQECYARLQGEIASCRPNVIVPLGNEAMKAVLGFKGVLDWRGSILSSPFGKVIPTIHPAALLHQWEYRPAVVHDFMRIADQAVFPEVNIAKHELHINPTFKEVMDYVEEAKSKEWLSFDIEVESGQITCIGLATEDTKGICIPFWFGASGSLWSEGEEGQIWAALRELLTSQTPKKIAHNGMYDCEYIAATTGIHTALHFDTMLAFHTLYPELPKGLDYLVSIYTDHPYYKYQRKTDSMDEHFRYNATDAVLTYKCFRSLHAELRDSGLDQFYESYVHSLVNPLLGVQLRGVNFDVEGRNRARKSYRYEISTLNHTLEQGLGRPLNVASYPQMVKWLYEDLKMKKIYKKRADGVKTLSADEEALHEHYLRSKNEAIRVVLDIRERNKTLSTYLEVPLDEDKRIRCSYNIAGTETGRLSSSTTGRGTGTNLQNIPRGVVKRLFLPDKGKVLINADLSQAEARVVAFLSSEERLIKVFAEGGDIHRRNASNIYHTPEDKVTKEQRELAKRVVHASNYGMGPKTFAQTAGIEQKEAVKLLSQYFTTYPRIKLWHMQIMDKLKKTRMLTTPFGRRRMFFAKWDHGLYKEGLAYIPQSTVADILNQGLLCAYEKGVEILLQVHDSIVVQCEDTPTSIAHTVATVRDCLTRPLEIQGRMMVIPVDVKIGPNWEDMVNYKEVKSG